MLEEVRRRVKSLRLFTLSHDSRYEKVQEKFGELDPHRSIHSDTIDSGVPTRLVSRSQFGDSAAAKGYPSMYC